MFMNFWIRVPVNITENHIFVGTYDYLLRTRKLPAPKGCALFSFSVSKNIKYLMNCSNLKLNYRSQSTYIEVYLKRKLVSKN